MNSPFPSRWERLISKKTAVVDGFVITLLFGLTLLIVRPLGNFPLDDDWSFALAVKEFLATGDFRPTGWTSMPLITNVLWGALFCWPAGCSFDALRLSTLVLGLAGVVGTYLLMGELRLSRWVALLAAATLACSPVYYRLAQTFMTDVPYTALVVLTVLAFVRHLQTGTRLAFVAGIVGTVVTTLSRQTALCIPMAFAVALVLKNGFAFRNLMRAVFPLALSSIALMWFQHWLQATGRLPVLYYMKNDELSHALTHLRTAFAVVGNVQIVVLYLGLFLLPLTAVFTKHLWMVCPADTRRNLLFSGALVGTLLLLNGRLHGIHFLLLPQIGNTLTPFGLGNPTLRDAVLLRLNYPPLPAGFWASVTAIAIFGAVLLLASMIAATEKLAIGFKPGRLAGQPAACVLLLLAVAIHLAPFILTSFFDRYLIPFIPLLAAGLAGLLQPQWQPAFSRPVRILVVSLVLAYGAFSVMGARDYLTWNRSRWEALDFLLQERHVPPSEIDGGFEFNGFYGYDAHYQPDASKSWWWVRNATYQIGFGPVPGYRIIRQYDYIQWLPPRAGRIVVLQKETTN